MIDCGRTTNFSPVKWLVENEMHTLVRWNGFALFHFIVTHSHDDHVEDIDNIVNQLPFAILYRQTDLDCLQYRIHLMRI
jgi:beta-lactamase superfamily II metal-dependent hydrolase